MARKRDDHSRHDGTPGLRRLSESLGGAIDDAGRPDPAKRRKQVFDAFFDVMKRDEERTRELCWFWFEQAYPALAEKWVREQKNKTEPMVAFKMNKDGTATATRYASKGKGYKEVPASKKRYRLTLSKAK